MVYSTNIPNLIDSIIELIRDTATITSITSSGTTRTINTADTGRLVVGDWVKISGTNYKITSITTNSKFTVTSSSAITGTSWTALAPYFFYGTPIMIANTIDKIKDYQNKYPIVVLFETMPATVDDDAKSSVERVVSLQLFFLDQANYTDWSHDEYYSLLLDVLQDYVDSFIDELKNNSSIGKFDSHKETPYSKWTLETGDGRNVFNAELSGIGIEIDLPVLKNTCSI